MKFKASGDWNLMVNLVHLYTHKIIKTDIFIKFSNLSYINAAFNFASFPILRFFPFFSYFYPISVSVILWFEKRTYTSKWSLCASSTFRPHFRIWYLQSIDSFIANFCKIDVHKIGITMVRQGLS